MNSTQTMKEARQLAWPWTILTAAGLLMLAGRGSLPSLYLSLGQFPIGQPTLRSLTDWIVPAGAFFGTVLLAALPLGTEFQYRTLAMRMAQPEERRALWRQKILVTLVAVAPVGAIYCTALDFRFGHPFAIMAAVWIVVAAAGAIPCTLIARSTIGGMVLVNFGTSIITIGWTYYEKHKHLPTELLIPLSVVLGAYVIFAVWLGRRMILRYQASDGMQAGETFIPGAQLVPEFVMNWLRARPTQHIANLVRREFRLLRVLWAMATLYTAAWIYLVAAHQLPNQDGNSLHVAFVLTAIFGAILAVLAGTLSLGEEKTWGTHQWHMTLPISVSTQWLIKLSVSLLTSVVCVAGIPMLILVIGGQFGDPAHYFLNGTIAVGWIAEATVITLASFWCSCAVQGTVQATLWVFPLCFSIWIAANAAPFVLSAFDHPLHLLTGKLLWHVNIVTFPEKIGSLLFPLLFGKDSFLVLALTPIVGVGLIQCHRAFRGQVTSNKLRVLRYALPLMAVAFGLNFATGTLFEVTRDAYRQQNVVVEQTTAALASIASSHASNGSLQPRRLSAADLEKVLPLSDWTERWLDNASITLAPAPAKVTRARFFMGTRFVFLHKRYAVPFSAVVRTRTGTVCSLGYQPSSGRMNLATVLCE